jgi:glycosyltransferase involved in cell wall biosynthesis
MSKETRRIVTGQFSDALVPIMDGVANVAHNYAYWLNKKYGDGYCIGPRVPDYRTEDPMDIRYLSIPIPKAAPYRYGLPRFDATYKKTLHEIPFDIVHSHAPFVSGKEALRIARRRQIPLVTTFHSKYRLIW